MKLYGKQKYSMSAAAIAYANNHLDSDKTARIKNNRVEIMKDGVWKDVGGVKDFANRWDTLNS